MKLLYLQKEWILFHGVHHVARPCFYGGPERTKQTLVRATVFVTFLAATTVECKMRADQWVATSLLDDSKSKHTGPLTTITLWPLPNTFQIPKLPD